MYLRSDGYRIAMVGTVALYNKEGERLHTTYVAVSRILTELSNVSQEKLSAEKKEKLNKTIVYFRNQKPRMKYSVQVKRNLPIGSGVIEAVCKTIVKQRLCKSGMKWKEKGASIVLSLRCLERSNKWEQF